MYLPACFALNFALRLLNLAFCFAHRALNFALDFWCHLLLHFFDIDLGQRFTPYLVGESTSIVMNRPRFIS